MWVIEWVLPAWPNGHLLASPQLLSWSRRWGARVGSMSWALLCAELQF